MSFAAEVRETEPEADELIQWVAHRLPWAIVGAFGVWAAWGWLADGVNALSLLLAVVFGLFQVATNILAVHVRALAHRGAWLTCLGAAGFMVATGLLTHEGLVHAYAEAQERNYASADPELMSWLLLVVPYLEPLMFWINRLLTEPARSKSSRPARGLIPWLIALIVGPGSVSPSLAHEPPMIPPSEPSEPRQVSQRLTKAHARNLHDPQRAQARLMLRGGSHPRDVHAATQVPISTLKRWKTEIENGAH